MKIERIMQIITLAQQVNALYHLRGCNHTVVVTLSSTSVEVSVMNLNSDDHETYTTYEQTEAFIYDPRLDAAEYRMKKILEEGNVVHT